MKSYELTAVYNDRETEELDAYNMHLTATFTEQDDDVIHVNWTIESWTRNENGEYNHDIAIDEGVLNLEIPDSYGNMWTHAKESKWGLLSWFLNNLGCNLDFMECDIKEITE